MPRTLFFAFASFFAASLALAAPAQAPAPYTPLVSDLGFTYNYPSDWEIVNINPSLPALKSSLDSTATSNDEKKGIDCTQISLLIRHGSPASIIETMVMPFDCLGIRYKDSDSSSVGMGVASGLSANLDVKNPVYGSYKIGSHSIWIEKAQGAFKSRPDTNMQIEVLCGILDKGVACWLAFAATGDALQTFENSIVKLEDDAQAKLVSADAFINSSK